MQDSFVSAIAAAHFAQRPGQPLLAGIASRINASNLSHALCCGCRTVQHLAWLRLVELPHSEQANLVLRNLEDETDERTDAISAVLLALTHESIPLSEQIVARVLQLLKSSRSKIQTAAASVIALRQPEEIAHFLSQQTAFGHDALRMICRADDPSLVVPLMAEFGFPSKNPPPPIGFLATARWLGENHSQHPHEVEWLVRNCGYSDETVTAESLNLLSAGFSYVTTRMTGEPRMTKIAHRWERRIRNLVWRLLPAELDLKPDDERPLDIDNPLDTDLFLAAVRDADRLAFAERKSVPPFSHLAAQRETMAVCFHASSRYVRRLFLEQPLAWSVRANVPPERRGEFFIEHARMLLEPNDDRRIAADRDLRGRWGSLKFQVTQTNGPRGQAVSEIPPPHLLVIKDFEPPELEGQLSPGANSIVALAVASGFDALEVKKYLCEAESRWSRCLLPMGIEVQIPQVNPDLFAAWKAALPFLGIRSPNRPEFQGMVEAAFRPARSFHTNVLGPLLLCRLGAIAEPQDMALHLSLQGAFTDRLRFIAFPHFFIHPSRRLRNRPDWSMARVMSKGFVHVHGDAERLSEADTQLQRTELRMFRIIADAASPNLEDCNSVASEQFETQAPAVELNLAVKLQPVYISDVIAVQILGSALASPCTRCQALFDEYSSDVEQSVEALPTEFGQLLRSNFFESTGEPRDVQLLKALPIFQTWSTVRATVRSQDLSGLLDLKYQRLRNQHVSQILRHWDEHHQLPSPEIQITDDDIKISLPPGMSFL